MLRVIAFFQQHHVNTAVRMPVVKTINVCAMKDLWEMELHVKVSVFFIEAALSVTVIATSDSCAKGQTLCKQVQ